MSKNNLKDNSSDGKDSLFSSSNLSVIASELGMIFIIIVLIMILSQVNFRFDLTEDKRFTLSEGTKNILKNIDRPISIKYYVTQSKELPSILANFSKRVEDLLLEYRKINKDFIRIEKFNPLPDTDDEDSARVDGIDQLQGNNGEVFYLGIVLSSLDKKISLSTLNYSREELLEYDLSRSILSITNDKKPKITVMSDIPLVGMPFGPQTTPSWHFYSQLEKDYQVQLISVKDAKIPVDTDVLMVFHPYGISEKSQYEIDQYVVNGGKVLAFVDPLFYSSRIYKSQNRNPMMQQSSPEEKSNLPLLLESWGIKYDDGKVIADSILKTAVSRTLKSMNILTLGSKYLNKKDITTLNLADMFLVQSGGFEINKKEGIDYTKLVVSSLENQFINTEDAEIDEIPIKKIYDNFKSDGKEKVLAVKLTGIFSSAFKDGIDKDKKTDHQKKGSKDATIILVSDADLLFNQFALTEQNFLGQRIISYANSNLSFMENSMEYLSGGDELIKVRSRVSPYKPFNVIREREREAEAKYSEVIKELQVEAEKVEEKINSLQLKKDNNNQTFVLSEEQKHELLKFKEIQKNNNKKLRQVRKELRKDIDGLKAFIKGFNILFTPILVIIFGIIYALYRKRRTGAN